MLARLILFAALVCTVLSARAQARPDVVVIFVDDMETQMVQYMPNVQNMIVKEGVDLRKAYFNDLLCCPSRAALLTGRYVQRDT
jgi:arylsulfatase A-like enzyme